jgi:predicted GNAT family N-acyltransferase
MRCGRIGNSSMVFTAAVFRASSAGAWRAGVRLCRPGHADQQAGAAAAARGAAGFEAGEPMLRVELADWATLGPAARSLRDEVFVQEQGIPADLVCDDADAGALHAVAFNRFGLPVAGGRLVDAGNGVAQLGRMATVQALRGSGLGRQVFDALVQAARHAGQRSLRLHAQTSAVPFYRRAGCTAEGEVFEVVGIPHQTMRLAL